MSYALIITTTTTDNITVRSNNISIRFINNAIRYNNNDIRFKIEIVTQIDIVYHEKPSSYIPICILANPKATLKMQKPMQPNAIRFCSFDNKTVQFSSIKGYLQQKIGTSCG